jgi:hypothetical protein
MAVETMLLFAKIANDTVLTNNLLAAGKPNHPDAEVGIEKF